MSLCLVCKRSLVSNLFSRVRFKLTQNEECKENELSHCISQEKGIRALENKSPKKSGRTGQGIHTVSLDPDTRPTTVDFIKSSIDVDELTFPHH